MAKATDLSDDIEIAPATGITADAPPAESAEAPETIAEPCLSGSKGLLTRLNDARELFRGLAAPLRERLARVPDILELIGYYPGRWSQALVDELASEDFGKQAAGEWICKVVFWELLQLPGKRDDKEFVCFARISAWLARLWYYRESWPPEAEELAVTWRTLMESLEPSQLVEAAGAVAYLKSFSPLLAATLGAAGARYPESKSLQDAIKKSIDKPQCPESRTAVGPLPDSSPARAEGEVLPSQEPSGNLWEPPTLSIAPAAAARGPDYQQPSEASQEAEHVPVGAADREVGLVLRTRADVDRLLSQVDDRADSEIWRSLREAGVRLSLADVGHVLQRAESAATDRTEREIWRSLREAGVRLSLADLTRFLKRNRARLPQADSLDSASSEIQVRAKARMERIMQAVAGKSFGSLENNRAVTNAIQRELNRLNLRVVCPQCEHPALLRWAVVGKYKHGALQFEHNVRGDQDHHGHFTTFPPDVGIFVRNAESESSPAAGSTRGRRKGARRHGTADRPD